MSSPTPNEIPDEILTGEDLRAILCHPSIGYSVGGEMPGTYLLTRGGGLIVPLFRLSSGAKRSYIEQEILSNFSITKTEFLEALKAVSSATTSSAPRPSSELPPPGSTAP